MKLFGLEIKRKMRVKKRKQLSNEDIAKRACNKCRWYEFYDSPDPNKVLVSNRCVHPRFNTVNPVTGEVKVGYKICEQERNSAEADTVCGVNGKYWEAKDGTD